MFSNLKNIDRGYYIYNEEKSWREIRHYVENKVIPKTELVKQITALVLNNSYEQVCHRHFYI